MRDKRTFEDILRRKVKDTIREYDMVKKGEGVVVALSGGPDSMCLLNVLKDISADYDMKLYAAHINHMIRGEEANADEDACGEFCKSIGVEYFSLRADVEKMAKEKGISTEMAGREVRYKFFEEIREKKGASKIAVAHNMNDQAETVLMHIMRGSGIEGLVGIKPVRENMFIRPIIKVSRHEIEGYCEEKKLPVRIDKTNFENIYSRNKVRLELIPYMEKNFNEDIISTLNRMSELLSNDNDYIKESVTKVFQKHCYISGEKVIIYKDAFKCHTSIISRVIREALMSAKGDINNIQSIHIENVIKLQQSETGKVTELPSDLVVSNVYGDIHIAKKKKVKADTDFNRELKIGENRINELGINILIKRVENSDLNLRGDYNTRYFNIDNIKKISLRFRKNGDKFMALGMKGSKKLKDIFIDMKIPREERDRIPLLCFDDDISWIVGYKISEKFKVQSGVQSIIEVRIERQE